ncbi:MAG: hypothetical protein LBT14_09815 [Treponema sp.]|jgi:hypothetical protein|nr:hypothetical protein [Treponema sp.]
MRDIVSLDDLWRQYACGTLQKKEFEGLIFQFILEHYQRFHLFDWDKDACTDYLCWLYPRISRAIEVYKDIGASFDSYIGSLVYWAAREYRSREADHYGTECACWAARAEEEMAVCSNDPEYWESGPVAKSIPNAQQLLVLLLKSYFFISEELLARAAPMIGIKRKRLRSLLDAIREQRLKQDDEVRNLQERIYGQYYRCIAYESKLAAVLAGTPAYEKIAGRLKRARTRFVAMKKRLTDCRLDPSNRQIAEVLGIPKGTVDSMLHAVKQKWKVDAV